MATIGVAGKIVEVYVIMAWLLLQGLQILWMFSQLQLMDLWYGNLLLAPIGIVKTGNL
jgi:hypothetical protein